MHNTLSHHLDRIALAIPEQRHELGLSRSDVALVAAIHGTTVGRLEDGRQIPPWELVRLAAALLVIEMYTAPASTALTLRSVGGAS